MELAFDKNVWNKCKATQKVRLFSDDCWRNEVIEGLKEANIVCSFALNGIVSHFDIMKVSNRFSFVVKVIAHFPRARLPSVAILTNISNCMPISKVQYYTSGRKKLAVTSVDLIAKQRKSVETQITTLASLGTTKTLGS